MSEPASTTWAAEETRCTSGAAGTDASGAAVDISGAACAMTGGAAIGTTGGSTRAAAADAQLGP